ncbi:unnamed protein product [Rotaria sp. Silwood1]|nr:unnamed protein product [Rotaria sp. Silwood1]
MFVFILTATNSLPLNETNSTSSSSDLNDLSTTSKEPLSLEAQRMIIKSRLQNDAPAGSPLNYGNVFGSRNADTCTTIRISASDMSKEQIKVDSYTGAVTWNIELKRVDSTSSIRLKKILVETSTNDIGMITIIPLALQNNGQLVQLNSISGQINSPITDFRMYYNMDIYSCLITMFPIYSGNAIDQNQISITVDYCSFIENQNRIPKFNSINPYYSRNNIDYKDNIVNQQPRIILTPSYQQPNIGQVYNAPSPARVVSSISGSINGITQTNPTSTTSCNQPQSLAMRSNSPNVVVQDNIWQINIDQMYGLPVVVDSLRVNTQGQLISGTVLLTWFDANQKQIGPYIFQMNTGSLLTFQNFPSTPISSIQIQFPNGIQSSSYLIDMVICPQTSVAPSAINSVENQPWSAPVPAPSPVQNSPNNPSIKITNVVPQSQSQQVPPTRYVLYASQSGQPLQQELSWPSLQSTKVIQQVQPAQTIRFAQPSQQSQPLQSSQSGQLSQQNQPSPAVQPGQANPQVSSWQLQQPGPVSAQSQFLPSPPSEQRNLQEKPQQPPQTGKLNQQSQPSPIPQPGRANLQSQPWQLQQPGPVYSQGPPSVSAPSEQTNQQRQPLPPAQPEQVNQQRQPLQPPPSVQDNQKDQPWQLPQNAPVNQQSQPWQHPQSVPAIRQGELWQLPQAAPVNQQSQPWQLPQAAPVYSQGQPLPQMQSGQINQQGQPWELPQSEPVNQQGQRWQPSYPNQVSQQGQPWQSEQGQAYQPNEAATPERLMGFYAGPNGRGPFPISGLYNQYSNNQNMYEQKPNFGTYNYNPLGQYPNNQYGPFMPSIAMQNIDDEIPCTLYLIRSGSRRIILNTTDDGRLTLLLQIPPKAGYISVPHFISALKTPLTQLSVNYLNENQSSASMSNGTALQFVAAPNASDIGTFPEHVPAQILQVNIVGAPAPLPPPSLEVHMIICYEPMSQVQPQQLTSPFQSTTQFQQYATLSNTQPTPSPQQPFLQGLQQQYQQSVTTTTTSATNTTTITTRKTVAGTAATTTTAANNASKTNPNSCSCQCQCPSGAVQPQIQGATVNYQYLPAPHHQVGRRHRRSDSSLDFFIHKE